ncbi:Aldo/keto reductase [Rhodocollybia butyracea]|uniref:Aldo/keto reductase n=1 Tax=Rhodocollybia butyracea TaxID=206335 RepID=A0A9P5PL37_9AGAR|nr:Aldo/keto reductase [Rhodocollybia butyracea]
MTLSISSTVKLSTGHLMPVLGFGVYQNYDAKPSCLEAFKAGYRHVDSAQMYRNEAAVGEAIRESGLKRSDLFITTKCASRSHGYENTLKGVDESLSKFQFDYIDLFLIHDPLSGKQRRLDTYKALQECKTAGKIRTVGVSNYNVKHLEEIRNAGYDLPAINQIELHPFCQQRGIVEYCSKYSIIVQAYCPIIRGKVDHEVFTSIAAKHKCESPAQVLIRWSLQKGYVPLPKSATSSRIHSNADVFGFELDADDMARIDALDKGKPGAVSWNPVDAE